MCSRLQESNDIDMAADEFWWAWAGSAGRPPGTTRWWHGHDVAELLDLFLVLLQLHANQRDEDAFDLRPYKLHRTI